MRSVNERSGVRWILGATLASLLVTLLGCGSTGSSSSSSSTAALEMLAMGHDPHSYSRPEAVRVKHGEFVWSLDFATHQLSGSVTWTVERTMASADQLILDTRSLEILSVEIPRDGGWVPAAYTAEVPVHATFGSPLIINLAGAERARVTYRTVGEPTGLQWLTKEQTFGKKKPFMFSQAQAVLARSFYPCQDTPSVRFTYDATITAPLGIRPVMAARMLESTGNTHRFEMPQPIPSYLVALAAGDLAFKEMGPRTGVWTEPGQLDAAAWEFADTEKMIDATEALYGPYQWERYDILVLPPAFPFGGMENPRLTFATPTILAGDRSLVSLVAHELAHSWSGNLVTNATWSDLWLNEGFTVYLERRIIESVYGPERAAMEAVLGKRDLSDDLESLDPADTVMHIELHGRDPDDVFSNIPYEKGYLFLRLLENAVGRPAFDIFLHQWFSEHAFQSQNAEDLERFLSERLFNGDTARMESLNLHEWIYGQGLPQNAPEPTSPRLDTIAQMGTTFLSDGNVTALNADTWNTQEWLHFLGTLGKQLPTERMAALDAAHPLTDSKNSEILAKWLELAIRSGYAPADDALEAFLIRVGRRKFLKPLYTALAETEAGKTKGRAIYKLARPGYHAISSNTIDQLLDYQP